MNKTLAGLTLLAALAGAADAFAVTYQVGPSRTHKQLTAVAGMLNPGDVVEVDGNATYSGVLWTRSGSASQPIIIRGMASGAQRPVINGNAAHDAFRMDVNHYHVENLVISNATWCVYLRGTNLILRRVVVHTCREHGILGSDTLTGDMLLTEVEVYNQGDPALVAPQGDGHHPIYISTDQVAYPNAVLRIEKSWIHDNHSGNSIKSRAKTVKIFHNWIEATNDQASVLELLGPDPGGLGMYPPGSGLCPVPDGTNDAQLCTGEVVGNVLIARGTRAFMMRLGSDGTGHSRGRYHVVNNAFIAGGAFASGGAMIRAFGPIQSIELHNNIFWMHNGDSTSYRIVRDRDAGGIFEAQWVNGKRVTGSRNLVTGSAAAYQSEPAATAISGLTNTIFAARDTVFANLTAAMVTSPAYTNLANLDVRIPSTSPARRMGNAGSTSTAGYQIPNPTNLPIFLPTMIRPGPGTSGSTIPTALRRPKPTDDAGFAVPSEISVGPFEYVYVPPGLDPAADQDNDGVPNGLEVGEGLNTLTKDNDVFANNRLFAMQQYRDFLGREGEASGIEFYDNLITSGAIQRVPVIESFIASPEFLNGLPQCTRLYFSFFGRIPDYGGLLFQVGQFRSGVQLDQIAQNFANSPEFTNRYGALTNDQYINLVYQNVLGRAPDPDGYNFYFTHLQNGTMTRGQMMIGFSESPEFQQLMLDEVFVVSVYVGMLRRTPEPAGLDFYIDLLEGGTPRAAIINGFFNSPEYHGRFLP